MKTISEVYIFVSVAGVSIGVASKKWRFFKWRAYLRKKLISIAFWRLKWFLQHKMVLSSIKDVALDNSAGFYRG